MLYKSLTFWKKAKKPVSYAESGAEEDDDDDEDVFKPISTNAKDRRASKRRKVVQDDSDDEFGVDEATEALMADEDGTLQLPSEVEAFTYH